jgi:hypothetical protein
MERKDDLFIFAVPDSMRGSTVTASEVRLYVHNLTAIAADVILTRPDRQVNGRPACSIEMLLPKSTAPLKLELFAPLDAEQVYGRSHTASGRFFFSIARRPRTLFGKLTTCSGAAL